MVFVNTDLMLLDHSFVVRNASFIPDKLTCGPSTEPLETHTDFLQFLPDPRDSFFGGHFSRPNFRVAACRSVLSSRAKAAERSIQRDGIGEWSDNASP